MSRHSVSISIRNDSRQASSWGESTSTPSTSKIAPWNGMILLTSPLVAAGAGHPIRVGRMTAHAASTLDREGATPRPHACQGGCLIGVVAEDEPAPEAHPRTASPSSRPSAGSRRPPAGPSNAHLLQFLALGLGHKPDDEEERQDGRGGVDAVGQAEPDVAEGREGRGNQPVAIHCAAAATLSA